MNIGGNFGEISEIPKIHEKFPRKSPENSRKFSGNFPEKLRFFLIQTQ